MFSVDDEEIELFDSDTEREDDLIEEEWGLSWEVNDIAEAEKQTELIQTSENNEKEEEVLSSPGSTPIERMALNDQKAGMQGIDKVKINKIIHDASKGSKYFENEKKKEKKTNERIEAMKNELSSYTESDRKKALTESNKILKNLCGSIDLTRTLVHIDMDAFYAAVEIRDNPKLKDVPMAVGGNSMLSTSNYVARRFGVRAAMPGFIAKKLCPELIIVPSHFEKYKAVSTDIRAIFSEYDSNFSPMSLDEAYLDLTDYLTENYYKYEQDENEREIVELIVEEMRQKIFDKTQLTASAGIAPNMMLSKICSDMNKPNGQYFLKPITAVITEFVNTLPIRKVFGIGKVSEQMLKALDIITCKDLYEKRDILYLLFSDSSFGYFMRVSLGISSNRITHSERKSMSGERTFHDVSDKDKLLKICYSICEHLSSDLAKENLQGRNITLKYKLSSFVTKTRSKTISYAVSKTDEIYALAKEILLNEIKSYGTEKFELRLMGVRICHFVEKECKKQNTVDQFFTANPGPSRPHEQQIKNNQDFIQSIRSDKGSIQPINIEENLIENQPHDEFELTISDEQVERDDFVQCPVCGISLKNDMTQLNLHIDSCLTKQTIKEIVKEQDREIASPKKHESKSRKRKSGDNLNVAGKKTTLFSFWKKT